MRRIFSTVFGPHEPALTVGSLAISATARPSTVPTPVTTPSAPRPSSCQFASSASSANESSSSSSATRSRTASLPCSAAFSWWRCGPPARARAEASCRSEASVSVDLVLNAAAPEGGGSGGSRARCGADGGRSRGLPRAGWRGRSRGSVHSEGRVGLWLLPGVVIEADPALAPEPPRAEHLAQRRRAREAPLAELVEEHVADRAQRVQPDEVGERERAHRVSGAGLHRLVDLVHRAHALLVRADRVEHVRHEQAVDDEARL